MIKEIEELQESVREDFACEDPETRRVNRLYARLSDTLGIIHQLAVKVERLEKRGKPRLRMERNRLRQVPEEEEGGHG